MKKHIRILDMEHLSKFKDLIYCPLDLPEPPEVDIKKLTEWMIETDKVATKNLINNGTADKIGLPIIGNAKSVEQQEYPWITTYPFVNSAVNVGWMNGFDKKFPEIVDYIKSFPAELGDLWGVQALAQKQEKTVFPHSDPEDWFGFRFYITEKERAQLYFHPSINPLEERIPTWRVRPDGKTEKVDLSKEYDFNKKLLVKRNSGKYPFILNSVRGVHAVETHNQEIGDRIIFFLGWKKFNKKSLIDLLNRSVEKYKDECLWR